MNTFKMISPRDSSKFLDNITGKPINVHFTANLIEMD